mmetsp:Transcript_103064/g.332111  ORF Transcript_103064/g.332111 Transcript_103064/m.332111 type:complete len:85 (-) Transcript_103064:3-257(-)
MVVFVFFGCKPQWLARFFAHLPSRAECRVALFFTALLLSAFAAVIRSLLTRRRAGDIREMVSTFSCVSSSRGSLVCCVIVGHIE